MDKVKEIPREIFSILQSSSRTTLDLDMLIGYLKVQGEFHCYHSKLNRNSLLQLASDFVLEEHKQGTVLFNKGDKADKLYLILQGQVNLYDNRKDGSKSLISKGQKGKLLGDRGLLRNEPRSLTARVKEHLFALTLPGEKFKSVMRKSLFKYFEEKLQFIEKNIPRISKYSLAHKEKLAYALELDKFKKNDLIVKEGEYVQYMHYIIFGECCVVRMNNNFLFLGPGSSIGDESIIMDKPSPYTIKAASDIVKVFKIRKDDFLSIMPDEILKSSKEFCILKESERTILNKTIAVPELSAYNRRVMTPSHIWNLASPRARKNINELLIRKSEGSLQMKSKSIFKHKLERLRDTTVGRFYKFNSPIRTIRKNASPTNKKLFG